MTMTPTTNSKLQGSRPQPVAPNGGLRIVMICPPLHSHLRAFEALALSLRARGHRPVFLAEAGAAIASGHEVHHLPGQGEDSGSGWLAGDIRRGARRSDRLCRLGPAILDRLAPDLILGDQTEPAAGLLAAALAIPFLSVACALPFDPEPGIALPFLSWPYDTSQAGLKRNAGGERIARLLMAPHRRVIRHWSERWHLGQREDFADCLSPCLTLSQTVPGFDHPRPQSGRRIVELGPFGRTDTQDFPADIIPDRGRPLVYVSLGTLQGHRWRLLARIAHACRTVGAQVLVSHGNALEPRQASRIPADWVRSFVPQQAVLARADMCVTHAGLNTTLECLAHGVPMLALPLTHDQPGVAARIEACGAGLRLGPAARRSGRIRAAVEQLLSQPGYRDAAGRFARESAGWEGAMGAIRQIEEVMAAVLRHAAARS